MVEDLHHKLRYFQVPVDCGSEVFCEGKAVVNNSDISASVLNKIHNSSCYHKVIEAQDADVLQVLWVPG